MSYDALTQKIMSLYDAYVYSITGVYFSMRTPGAQISPRLVSEFKRVSTSIKKTYINHVAEAMFGFTSSLNSNAPTPETPILDDIAAIADANIRTLKDQMTGRSAAFSSMLKDAGGGVGRLLQRKLEKPTFKAVDASGRTWEAKTLLKTMVRGYGYQAKIKADLLKVSGDLAVVTYANPEHENNGLVFSIYGKTEGYPTYDEIRTKVFHPNATAQVAQYVSPK